MSLGDARLDCQIERVFWQRRHFVRHEELKMLLNGLINIIITTPYSPHVIEKYFRPVVGDVLCVLDSLTVMSSFDCAASTTWFQSNLGE